MKSQKRSRLFRALLCSSAAVTAVSPAFGQDGVTRVSSQPSTPNPLGSDGVASTANQNGGVAQVPTYALPDYTPPRGPQGYSVPNRTVWQDELGPRFLLETRIGEWLGSTGDGESAVNVMLPFTFENSSSLVFLDARGTATWNGGGSGTVGTGFRWYDEFRNRITGVSGFWDYDDGNENSYDQAGISFESVGKWFTIHANGYIALGDETNILNTRARSFLELRLRPRPYRGSKLLTAVSTSKSAARRRYSVNMDFRHTSVRIISKLPMLKMQPVFHSAPTSICQTIYNSALTSPMTQPSELSFLVPSFYNYPVDGRSNSFVLARSSTEFLIESNVVTESQQTELFGLFRFR